MKSLILIFLPLFLFGHSLSTTASYEDGELFVESYFGDGNPCKGCGFTVSKNNKTLYEDNLDHTGVFEKNVELKPPFDVHVDGGMGHWADVKINGTEIESDEIDTSKEATSESSVGLSETQIRKIIRSELNKQNAKIEMMVDKNKSKLEEMLVGLGYILGIFALWQFFIRKKENN
ncbi:MAG: hypothetical protein OIF32_07920 [Campylobacterales bacterium]|nr:hypothetical protein [Campylobacterales bacterium]